MKIKLHPTLIRQLKKTGVDFESLPENSKELLIRVNDTYVHAEESRILAERSLDLSSRELEARAKELDRTKEIERINGFMVNREIKMVELKEEINRLRTENDALKRIGGKEV